MLLQSDRHDVIVPQEVGGPVGRQLKAADRQRQLLRRDALQAEERDQLWLFF
jgi:hypothetical protein